MRLIDADALKKDLKQYFSDGVLDGVSARLAFNQILHDIDNAPTVEPCYQTTSCLDYKMYDKEKHNCPRFCEVIRSVIEERPQGECEKCDYRKFTETFIDGVVEVMNKNGITSVEQLSEILKGGKET